jgi:hypothetical protein
VFYRINCQIENNDKFCTSATLAQHGTNILIDHVVQKFYTYMKEVKPVQIMTVLVYIFELHVFAEVSVISFYMYFFFSNKTLLHFSV